MHKEAEDRGVEFVLVGVDQKRELLEGFATEIRAMETGVRNVPVLFSSKVGRSLDVRFVPYYLAIDGEGQLVGREVGVTSLARTVTDRARGLVDLLSPSPAGAGR